MTLQQLVKYITPRIGKILASSYTGKIVIEINASNGGISTLYVETREKIVKK